METIENIKKWFFKHFFVLIALLGIALIWWGNWFILKDDPNRGTFGDMYGGVNAIFSGFALLGIIYTILQQKKSLDYQQQELKATTEEFITQNKTLKFQRFENTFFNLLSLHHQIIDGMDIEEKRSKSSHFSKGFSLISDPEYTTINKRDVFKHMYNELICKLERVTDYNTVSSIYIKFWATVQTDFGHYFRNLYRIIKFVEETEFCSVEELGKDNNGSSHYEENFKIKYKYISMVRAQLSDYELLWLFYNCLSDNGVEKFKPLVEKYTLLKNMPIDKLHDCEFRHAYETSAFTKKNKSETTTTIS